MAGSLNIFTEVQKEKFECKQRHKSLQILLQLLEKKLFDLLLKRPELIKSSLTPELRSFCSAKNEPTDLFSGDKLTKHVKDLTVTNKLKRNERY